MVSSNHILPSSGAIHTKTSENNTTFYYSSLTIDYGSNHHQKRKVHLGDMVAVSKNHQGTSIPALIDSWRPNHYVQKSLDWKVGLVVVLRKVISRKTPGAIFECHVQWLDKALDLEKKEMTAANLKSVYRPYNTNSKDVGSQLPHVLINCPGRFGVVSMLPTFPNDKDYCILLPVHIQMKAHRDFMKNGVKEKEESRTELQFCCTKTRKNHATFLNEKDPDAWVQLNGPSKTDQVPEPLQKAWKAWLQTESCELQGVLQDALTRGWKKSHQEKYEKAMHQNNKASEKDHVGDNPKRSRAHMDVKTQKRLKTFAMEGTERKPRKIRFSSDTKEPSFSEDCAPRPKAKRKKGLESAQTIAEQKRKSKIPCKTKPLHLQTAREDRKCRQSGNDDDIASTNTRDTHSTDTTILARGGGNKWGASKGSNGDDRHSRVANQGTVHSIHRNVEYSIQKPPPFYSTKQRDYFHELNLTLPTPLLKSLLDDSLRHTEGWKTPSDRSFTIQIGRIVAIHYRDSLSSTMSWFPFQVPWGIAQITNIFSEKDSGDREIFRLGIKWFYRFLELPDERRTVELASMNQRDDLVETYETCDCSLTELLPAFVALTSKKKEISRQEWEGGLPHIQMLCQHLEETQGNIIRNSDWSFGYSRFLGTLPACSPEAFLGPFHRALTKMPLRTKKKYNAWLAESSRQIPVDSHKTSTVPTPLDVTPVTNRVLFEDSDQSFFDAISLNVRKTDLHENLRSQCSNRWTIGVGHVIAILCKSVALDRSKCYPLERKWCPGQVVALYKGKGGKWMMEIRWFDRFDEIREEHKRSHSQLDRPHILFEGDIYEHLPVSDALPGRVILSSVEDHNHWDVRISKCVGIPLIPRLCTHMCHGKNIERSMEWTNYDLQLRQIPSGLIRGLQQTPRNRRHKKRILKLSLSYFTAIGKRDPDPDSDELKTWSGEEVFDGKSGIQCTHFDPGDTVATPKSHLLRINGGKASKDFYRSMVVSVPTNYLVSPTTEMKRVKKHTFECEIGDVICYFVNKGESRKVRQPLTAKAVPSPFRLPYAYGQILTIYNEPNKENLKMEVRRFYRVADIPDEARTFLQIREMNHPEEIFESNKVELGIEASSIIGRVDLLLGDEERKSGKSTSSKERRGIVSCQLHYFYLSNFKKLQPIYWSSSMPKIRQNELFRRGHKMSSLVENYEKLRDLYFDITKPFSRIDHFYDMNIDSKNSPTEGSCLRLGKQIQSSVQCVSFYEDALVNPQWSLFCAPDYWSLTEISERKMWKTRIGDVVALKDHRTTRTDIVHYPFRSRWIPGQILAIYTETSKNSLKDIRYEIRCLGFDKSPQSKNGMERIGVVGITPEKIITAPSADLLGPLTIYSSAHEHRSELTNIHSNLPFLEVYAPSSLKLNRLNIASLSKVHRLSKITDVQELKTADSPTREDSFAKSLVRDSMIPWKDQYQNSNPPVRIDTIHFRLFYSSVTLFPQFKKCFDAGACKETTSPTSITIGDTMRVRVEGPKRFPYDCNWCVAEIVTIFKEFSSQNDFDDAKTLCSSQICGGKLMFEVRWFYERSDISLSASSCVDETNLIEVFETDKCCVIDANHAVLDHVQLVENVIESMSDDKDQFLCTRFWSTKRRSLIPCGGLDGRVKRGLMYSATSMDDDNVKSSPRSENHTAESKSNPKAWVDSIARVIEKLTLKDASESAFERGDTLVGREKELSQLLTFFRAALTQDHKPDGYKPSMFIGGPPGVGKTASVRAAIARLHHEQRAQNVPPFKFISLNGIEVRHPTDIYIRLWEALTGRNHVGSYEIACQRLETLFTDEVCEQSMRNSSTIIVLLDEIDYLVTQDQDVLYNLFEWPKRAATVASKLRLIVVGISNTLNLVDQLMPSVQSRAGTEKCLFNAYSLNDTTAILKSKIKEGSSDIEFFENDAIVFAAKKTAALSGDIRRAFQICRAAAEMVCQKFLKESGESGEKPMSYPKIRISDVQKVSQESFNMALVTAVSFSSSFEALLLVSLATLRRSTGRQVGGFDVKDVISKMEALAYASGESYYVPPPSFGETLGLLSKLGEMNLVELRTSKSSSRICRQYQGGVWPMASLAIDDFTLLKGFKKTLHKSLAQSHLATTF